MPKIVWQEVVYRCDNEKCSTWNGNCYSMAEVQIPGTPRQANKIIKGLGWIVKRDGTCICPKCVKSKEDTPCNASRAQMKDI